MTATNALPNRTCPLCGGANECAPAKTGHFDVVCWCTNAVISQESLARVPEYLVNKACLCPRCAEGLGDDESMRGELVQPHSTTT